MAPRGHHLTAQIAESLPLRQWLGFPLIVAVSGGADSVALLRLIHEMRNHWIDSSAPLFVAHVNHGLRGIESDGDEAFVGELAGQLGFAFLAQQSPSDPNDSEEQLRNNRYAILLKAAHQYGARVIATGHTADDQVETILFRIFRGTGLSGMAGMESIRALDSNVSLIRPMLEISRGEVEQFLAELGQPFRFDVSNQSDHYTRNFLRLQILPQLIERFGPQLKSNLSRLGKQAAETESFLTDQARPFFASVRFEPGGEVQIDCRRLKQQPDLVLRQFFKRIWLEQAWPLQAMGYDKWQQLSEFSRRVTAAAIEMPGQVRCEIAADQLSLKRANRTAGMMI